MLAVSYMGTKRHLANSVAELAVNCKEGALLDVFSGMCAVGQAVAPNRPIWSNDLQTFAVLVARCQFCHPGASPTADMAEEDLSRHFGRHLNTLLLENQQEVNTEKSAIERVCYGTLSKLFEDQIFVANRLHHGSGTNYRLFLQRYAGTYLGWQQCAEIDSLRYAIDQIVDQPRKDWFLVALSGAMARCANTTGHFAQALYPKASNIRKIVGQRGRSIWTEFLYAVDRLEAIGSDDWRTKNRVFRSDAGKLLADLEGTTEVGVVYADPPYTADQYSRYYHLYETLILYDYPSARGRGLYRDDRAVS